MSGPGIPAAQAPAPLVSVSNLSKRYVQRSGYTIDALRSVSLSIGRGEVVGVVGESGCGKSTLARCLVGLERPSSGSIEFDGIELVGASRSRIQPLRRRFQIVFQNATTSLNPSLTLRRAVAEPIRLHRPEIDDPNEAALDLLESVGLRRQLADRYPRALSGGQRQRVGIARAIACNPDFLVLDEPTSSLDLSVRAQILRLLLELQRRLHLTFLFISHDLGVIRNVADRVAVMYAGEIVETAGVEDLVKDPQHPYTAGLLAAADLGLERRPAGPQPLRGEASQLPAQGCPLHPRCPQVMEVCRENAPLLLPLMNGRQVSCFLRHPLNTEGAIHAHD